MNSQYDNPESIKPRYFVMDSVVSLPTFVFVECSECGWLYVEPKTPDDSVVFCSPGCREADLLKQLQAAKKMGTKNVYPY